MAQKKGKTGNPNGRPRGIPNRITSDLRQWVDMLIQSNISQFEADLKKIEPAQRLNVLEKLLQYCLPKQQSITVEQQIQAEYGAIEKLLTAAPEDAINEITERLIRLNQLNRGHE